MKIKQNSIDLNSDSKRRNFELSQINENLKKKSTGVALKREKKLI